jgi:hypothetical protein
VPVETKQAIDFTVTTHSLPLYAKTLDFVQRDRSYARLVSQVAPGDDSPESRALAVFNWTREHIRDQPPQLPVIDDHVWHIVIRGYGVSDQKADVFTTLATYAGLPAFVGPSRLGQPHADLSFVWMSGDWRVFDVQNGIVFRRRDGTLAAAADLAADHELVRLAAAGRVYRSRPYESLFEGFRPPVPPSILRAELQMPWPRLTYRAMQFVGLGRRDWEQQR